MPISLMINSGSCVNFLQTLSNHANFFQGYFPIDIDSPDALFDSLKDGIILCKLVNWVSPGTVDERAINRNKLNVYTVHENITLALNSASSIGCGIINIGPEDILNGTPHLVLGLLWQLLRVKKFQFLKYWRSFIVLPKETTLSRAIHIICIFMIE